MQKDSIISDSESISFVGGAFTSALLSAVNVLLKNLYNAGQNLGSSIYRLVFKKGC